ncbi:MAG: NAD(P)-binding domain-containing protein [Acidobacteriia bacterium]|nr:NAD(P)-binding domain-containing protein [Terriglobia bacterium]
MTHNHFGSQFTIVGAGPYGLSVASHLRSAGIEARIFGKPMDFWGTQMPKGMLLRSPWSGSNLSDPKQLFTLDRYEMALGSALNRRVPLADFVRYGQWFQRQAVPDLDQRNVASIERSGDGYRVRLDDGETYYSQNVVVAGGIGSFANRPAQFGSLPAELCSHASDRVNSDLGRFAGKRVAVIGAGQTATESAALLHESGADVEVVMRQPQLRWLHTRPLIEWLMDSPLYPFKAPGKIGPIGLNWLLEHPALFTLPSRETQEKMAYRAIRPAASGWLKARTQQVTFTTGRHVVAAEERGGKVHLTLDNGAERTADHVLLGTGYKIDIKRYAFLGGDLLRQVHIANGFPVLNRGYESSMPGLYFVGAPAAHSFGPYMRFVAGAGYASKTLSSHVVRTQAKRVVRSYGERTAAADAR